MEKSMSVEEKLQKAIDCLSYYASDKYIVQLGSGYAKMVLEEIRDCE